jgi:hypothetical protein
MTETNNRPWSAWILIILVLFQAVSAIYGGIMMILDPSGELMKMEPMAEKSINESLLIPGFILALLLGVFPLMAFFGLIRKKDSKLFDTINVYKGEHHWAWTFSIYTGIMLVIWIAVQSQMVGGGHWLQTTYSLTGIAIIIAALLPPVKRWYSRYPS